MHRILLLALAGACGTLARYWVSSAAYSVFGRSLPWGTWTVNVLGCFLFGLVWVLAEERGVLSAETRLTILVGFMGAFTTFSTYIFESNELLRGAQLLATAANLLGQVLLGFAALVLGMALGRLV